MNIFFLTSHSYDSSSSYFYKYYKEILQSKIYKTSEKLQIPINLKFITPLNDESNNNNFQIKKELDGLKKIKNKKFVLLGYGNKKPSDKKTLLFFKSLFGKEFSLSFCKTGSVSFKHIIGKDVLISKEFIDKYSDNTYTKKCLEYFLGSKIYFFNTLRTHMLRGWKFLYQYHHQLVFLIVV